MNVATQLNTALAGRYTIDKEIGRGGMATVYLARDIKHDRDVALKVLHPDLAAALGAERFLAEIKTTAALQHPHILPLLDSGEARRHPDADRSEGEGSALLFYVMPYVSGDSLRTRLEREGMLPVDTAIRIAQETLSALDYAHRHRVVHRDIKPENILLHDGSALVADFGIALAVQSAGGQRMTQTGLSLGTPQYMSPEQAMGERQVDGRADIYAMGAVLYEMLTGEPPFSGASVQAIVAKVMTERPMSPRVVRDTIPPSIESAVMRALAKLPADRFATAKEFSEAFTEKQTVPSVPGDTGRRSLRWAQAAIPWLLATGLLVWIGATRLGRSGPGLPPPMRFTVDLPEPERLMINGATFAISPDGQTIVYTADSAGDRHLYVRALNDLAPRSLAGTSGALSPAFSADGRWIAFQIGPRVMKIAVDGGAVAMVTEAAGGAGTAWSPRGELLFMRPGKRVGLSRVNAGGGAVRSLTLSDSAHGIAHIRPLVVDGGRHFLFIAAGPGGVEDDFLAIGSMETGEYSVTAELAARPLGIVNGHVIFSRNGDLMAAPIDLARRRLTGDAIAVSDRATPGGVSPALSDNGTLVSIATDARQQLVWVNQAGAATPVASETRVFVGYPRLSPDARHAVFEVGDLAGDSHASTWMMEVASGVMTRFSPSVGVRPDWSADGARVFSATGATKTPMMFRAADMSDSAQVLRVPPSFVNGDDEVPPEQGLPGLMRRGGQGLFALDDSLRAQLLSGTAGATAARLSRDRHWITYVSSQSGRRDVYGRAFPGPSGVVQVSASGGTEPMWSADGNRIYYRDGQRMIAATLARTGNALSVVSRVALFADGFVPSSNVSVRANYDVAPDGRFLIVRSIGGTERLLVIPNWTTEVQRKIGGP